MPSIPVRWALAAAAFVALWLIAVAVSVPAIEDDLTSRVERQLAAAGVTQVAVSFDGRDGTLRGPADQRDAALAAVSDRNGIRSLEYEVGAPAPVSTTTVAPGEVTVASSVTTAPASTTTSTTSTTTTTSSTTTTTTSTTTTTAAPGPTLDASATIAGQGVRLDGFVATEEQHQALVAAATSAFTPQGQVVDELEVRTGPPSQGAVDALAQALEVAGPTLASGTLRAEPDSLTLSNGEAFSGAAADALGAQLDSIGAQNGVTVDQQLDPAQNDDDNLQSSLDALIGRSGITFAPNSSDVDGLSQATLDSVAELLLEVPDPLIEVRGHTDSIGPAGPNQELSEERAAAVVADLVDRRVAAERLTATGAGETEPLAPNDTEEGRARNRRIELIVREEG